MSVDELIERSGNGESADQKVAAPVQSPVEPAPQITDPTAEGKKFNWTLMVAVLALLVAVFAAWLIWSNMGSQSAVADPAATTEAEAIEEPAAEPSPPEEEPVPTDPVPPAPVVIAPPVSPEIRPSFNCDKASFRIEFLICGSAELADLDRALASSYTRAMAAVGSNSERLKREQRAWRIEIRDVCQDSDCAAKTMRERIARLKEIAVRGMGSRGFSPQTC